MKEKEISNIDAFFLKNNGLIIPTEYLDKIHDFIEYIVLLVKLFYKLYTEPEKSDEYTTFILDDPRVLNGIENTEVVKGCIKAAEYIIKKDDIYANIDMKCSDDGRTLSVLERR